MKDKYLEDLKKSNDKLRFEIAEKIAKRDLEVYQLADRLATIMGKFLTSVSNTQNTQILRICEKTEQDFCLIVTNTITL